LVTPGWNLFLQERKGVFSPGHPRRISPEKRLCPHLPSRHPLLGELLHGRPALRVGREGKESNACYFDSTPLEPK